MNDNKQNAKQIVELGKRMQFADWSYYFSPDASRREAGEREWKSISAALKELAQADQKAANDLWNQHAPKDFQRPDFLGERNEVAQEVGGQETAVENAMRQAASVDEGEEKNRSTSTLDDPAKTENSIRPASHADDHKNATNGLTNDAAANAPVAPPTLLGGRFVRDAAGIYRREGETREALADEGTKIRFIDKQMDTFEAGVELAKAKGWSAIEVTGSEQFRAEAWFHAKAAGLDVVGYEPKEQDLKRLETQGRAPGVAVDVPNEGEQSIVSREVAASKSEAFDQAVKRGIGVVSVNADKGRYTGKVLYESEHHLVQEVGRNAAVIHDKRDLGGDLKTLVGRSQPVRVTYQNGRGVATAAERSPELGR